MVAITRSGRYYLTGFGIAFLAGLAMGNFTYLLLGLLLLGFLLAGMRLGIPRRVELERTFSTTHATVGDTVTVKVQAIIYSGRGFVQLHDRLPDVFTLLEGNNTHLVWKGARAKKVTYQYTFKCTKRGGFTFSGTEAIGIHMLALIESVRVGRGASTELVVEPRVLKVRRVKHLRGKAASIFPAGDKAKVGTLTTDFEELRAYTPGDPLKSVNWKATARQTVGDDVQLMVNQYDVEGKKSIWFFIDAADYMEVGSTLSNTFDQTIEAALELLEHFIGRGYRVGGTVYNTVGDSHDAPLFYPDHGRSQYLKIMKTLTGIGTASVHEGLAQAVERSRGFLVREKPLVLLVTRPDGDFKRTLQGLKRLMTYVAIGNRPPPILLVAPLVSNAAAGSQDVSDLALMLVEEEASLKNKALRRLGVTLVEWDPQHSPVGAVLSRGVRTR